MKRKKLFLLLAALIVVAAISTTLAFMFKKTSFDNRFIPGTVSCQLCETVDGTEYIGGGVLQSRILRWKTLEAYLLLYGCALFPIGRMQTEIRSGFPRSFPR